jgi:hypothetical protein
MGDGFTAFSQRVHRRQRPQAARWRGLGQQHRSGSPTADPIRHDGAAGPIQTVATGLDGIDDFAFTGRGDDASILAAINGASVVKLIQPSGNSQTVLTATDGLSNPTSIAVRHDAVYVPSAAYVTQKDPNLLLARLDD